MACEPVTIESALCVAAGGVPVAGVSAALAETAAAISREPVKANNLIIGFIL